MKIKSDYTNALDRIKSGELYAALIERVDEHRSKKNTPCVKVLFRIQGGTFSGWTVPCILPLEGKAAGYFRRFVQAVKPEYVDGDIDSSELIGKSVKILLSDSTRVEGERSYFKVSVYPETYVRQEAVGGSEQSTTQNGVGGAQ